MNNKLIKFEKQQLGAVEAQAVKGGSFTSQLSSLDSSMRATVVSRVLGSGNSLSSVRLSSISISGSLATLRIRTRIGPNLTISLPNRGGMGND